MSDEGVHPEKLPTTQQEFNLAAMEAIRHVAEWCMKLNSLAAHGAANEYKAQLAAGNKKRADEIMATGDEVRKAGLRYHNAALEMWEAFQRDAGEDLVTPRQLPPRAEVDDE